MLLTLLGFDLAISRAAPASDNLRLGGVGLLLMTMLVESWPRSSTPQEARLHGYRTAVLGKGGSLGRDLIKRMIYLENELEEIDEVVQSSWTGNGLNCSCKEQSIERRALNL
ncbi:hypothetical protein L228DRAFT_177831 [Xylona heveae TC161]|uniref:Uncharacterized protein n=1 Tax=Xylona heveae (strain CBS 132557 / TC161) TaxID=1328760 RepID=A0A165F8V4_XYLHT|nr:hypothetical protein L228DRAFT_177831 [Xylona heveae TC161]KZF20714.1 hypothetical protein L228DRAFT_177831 [Xylona heveae TC161]